MIDTFQPSPGAPSADFRIAGDAAGSAGSVDDPQRMLARNDSDMLIVPKAVRFMFRFRAAGA